MSKVRIIERTDSGGDVSFVIQKKLPVSRVWVDAESHFESVDQAKRLLHLFDGTQAIDRTVWVAGDTL